MAGFVIKLTFYEPRSNRQINTFPRMIARLLTGFVFLNSKRVTADFHIKFIDHYKAHTLMDKKSLITYINFYHQKTNHTIYTFYHISLRQFQMILNKVMETLLKKKDGFILHASSNIVRDKAFIFTGKSGAGKSTVIKLLKDKFEAFGDDSVIIVREKKEYYAYQTTYIEKESWVKKQSQRYKIGKVYFLKKANEFNIRRCIDKKLVAKKLLEQLKHESVVSTETGAKPLMNFVFNFDNFYILGFKKEKSGLIKMINDHIST